MKEILWFICGAVFIQTVNAQNINHIPFVEEGKVWNMLCNNAEAYLYPSYQYRYYIEGDTLISSLNCKKLYAYNENNDGQTQYKMALHESGGKVYFIPNGSTESYLLYDFQIPEGSSAIMANPIHPEWELEMRNNKDRIIETNGVNRHCLHVNRVDASFEDYPSGWWIEGIGSELGPLNTWGFKAAGNSCYFQNCEVNGQEIFNLSDFQSNTEKDEYYPEGTKWTEIRLDTLKYDSWYSKVGNEWVPNYETIEYRVQGEYIDERFNDKYSCIYTNGPEWADSLTLLIYGGRNQDADWYGGIAVAAFDDDGQLSWPCHGQMYPLSWEVGTIMRSLSINMAGITGAGDWMWDVYGTVEEIKEGDFGGVRPLKYSDVNGIRFIQGIGVASWNDGECIFGPIRPYDVLSSFWTVKPKERHYRSMLVHFERDGEVLYNIWPEKISTGICSLTPDPSPVREGSIYDLQGRRLSGKPARGIYIEDGKKKVK